MEDFERMYNEAHEAAEKIHRFSSDPKEIKRMEELFPDLKMSEDERMRRNLIRIFKAYQNPATHINSDMWEGLEISKILEWLEKKKKDCSWPENISNCKHNCKICFAKCLYRKEEATMMVQWKGHNLKEVVDFTGLYEKFDDWFGSWEEYEAYVHSHNDIFKIFCKDGSHYEVPVGAWIIRTPEGYNVPSCFVFKPKKSENDERLRDTTIAFLEEFKAKGYENAVECIDWLNSQVLEWNPVCSEIYIEEPVLVQKKNKSDQFGGYIVCCDHTLTPDLYERYLKLSDVKSKSKPVDLEKELENWLGDREGKWKGEECENMCRYFFELGLNAQTNKKISDDWDEDDEIMLNNTIILLEHYAKGLRDLEKNASIEWLKSLTKRKFKVGDWLQYRSHKPFLVEAITKQGYCSGDECLPFNWEDEIHLWTIKDAKPGDILEFGDHGRLVIGITSYINYQNGKVDVSCLLENDKFKAGNYYALDTIKPHPATKEQCDILFEKMKDTGYKWNPSTLNLEYILKES